MSDDLKAFADRAVSQFGIPFGEPVDDEPRATDEFETDPEDAPVASTDADDADDDDEEEVGDEEARDFYDSLSPEDRERATADLDFRQEAWDRWEAERAEQDDDDQDDDAGSPEDGEDFVPSNAREVVEWAAANEDGLLGVGWDSVDEFLITAASDARWWLETASNMGWSPDVRPGERDLPARLGMSVIAASIPGARVVRDPLQSMFSKEQRSSVTRAGRGSVTPRKP